MPHSVCQRCRSIAALSVDGEASDFELRALARHVQRCDACRAFAERVGTLTAHLRATPPERVLLDWTAPRRGRLASVLIGRSMASVAAASTVAVAVFAGLAYDVFRSNTEGARTLPVHVIDTSGTDVARETQKFLQGVRDASLARTVTGATLSGPRRPGVRDA